MGHFLHTVKGSVTAKRDRPNSGIFYAIFDKATHEELPVIYTSPMWRVNGGGIMAMPMEGDIILAAHDDVTGKYYYHSTIVAMELEGETMRVPNFVEIPDSKAFSNDGKPVKVKFTDAAGAGLEITRNFRPTPLSPICSVNLLSEKGKKISLDDSPGVDAIVIQSQHVGDGIQLTGDVPFNQPAIDGNFNAARSLRVSTEGPHMYESRGSSMDIKVVDGLDINIENKSSGVNAQRPSEQYWPNKDENGNPKQPCRKWGGIYLRSDNGDVSIAANAATGDVAADGRIFIVTPKARIQILEDGSIAIDSTASIKLRSDGDLNMEGANVSIKANGSLNLESGADTSILSSGNVNADGTQIHLNSGNSVSVPSLGVHSDNDLNDFKE